LRGAAFAAGCVSIAMVATGCTGGGSGGNNAGGGSTDILKWAIPSAPRSLDMYSDFSSNSSTIIGLISPGLVQLKDLKLEPALATSWKVVSPTKLIFNLRKGVKFSNGDPVTTEDVIYSFERMIGPNTKAQTASHLSHLKKITKTGAHQVTMVLNTPDSTFKYDPLFAPIVDKKVVEAAGDNYGAPGTKIVGAGPYKVAKFDASNGITLKRNDKFWGAKAKFNTIDFSYISDEQTLSLALQSGDVDGVFAVPTEQATHLEKMSNVSVSSGPGLSVASLSFDLTKKPLNDIHVRRAFAYAWDAEGFTKSVLNGYAKPANAVESPDFWGDLVPKATVKKIYDKIPSYQYSMAKARAELKKSVVPHGFSTSISYPDARPDAGKALQALSASLAKIGIKLKVNEIPYQQWVTEISGHKNLGLQIAMWFPDYPDPSDLILSQYPSSHAVPNQYNLANFKDPQVDALVNKELGSTDAQTRAAAMGKIMKIVGEKLPDLYLFWPKNIMAIRAPYKYSGYNAFYYSQNWTDNISVK